ncbi:MAG TPA: hypothetical protein VNZ52_07670 [Candidatus Thermoplasmatota archaeon]|nr:hypothetical protein [Candidatus Thermoplasmatota archaeon]
MALADPRILLAVAAQVSAHLLLGRETGIPAGIAAGAPTWLVGFVAFTQDALVLLVGYPIACSLGRGTLRFRWLRRFAPPEAREVRARTKRSEPVGVALLAGSLWVPFLPSGALVAALAGRALGYRTGVLLPALLGSMLLATVAYTALFTSVVATVDDPRITWLLVGIGAVIAVGVGFALRLRAQRRA